MSLTKATGGDRLILLSNVMPRLPSATYTSAVPAFGDLVKNSSTNNAVDHCANNDTPIGVVISTNWTNGILSIARFTANVQIWLDYTGSVALGDKVVSTGAKGAVRTAYDSVKTDNTNGVGTIIAKDAGSPGGTGTCVVQF